MKKYLNIELLKESALEKNPVDIIFQLRADKMCERLLTVPQITFRVFTTFAGLPPGRLARVFAKAKTVTKANVVEAKPRPKAPLGAAA
jgi:hypothetical protein